MQPLDAVYLQILKNLCTDLSEPVPLDGVDPSALYRLAEKHVVRIWQPAAGGLGLE